MINLTANIDEVLKAENAIVYFTASWCQPCKQLKPIYAKVGMQDQINNYFIIDIETIDKDILNLYNIKSVPTIFKMDKGAVIKKITARSAEDIIEQINETSGDIN